MKIIPLCILASILCLGTLFAEEAFEENKSKPISLSGIYTYFEELSTWELHSEQTGNTLRKLKPKFNSTHESQMGRVSTEGTKNLEVLYEAAKDILLTFMKDFKKFQTKNTDLINFINSPNTNSDIKTQYAEHIYRIERPISDYTSSDLLETIPFNPSEFDFWVKNYSEYFRRDRWGAPGALQAEFDRFKNQMKAVEKLASDWESSVDTPESIDLLFETIEKILPLTLSDPNEKIISLYRTRGYSVFLSDIGNRFLSKLMANPVAMSLLNLERRHLVRSMFASQLVSLEGATTFLHESLKTSHSLEKWLSIKNPIDAKDDFKGFFNNVGNNLPISALDHFISFKPSITELVEYLVQNRPISTLMMENWRTTKLPVFLTKEDSRSIKVFAIIEAEAKKVREYLQTSEERNEFVQRAIENSIDLRNFRRLPRLRPGLRPFIRSPLAEYIRPFILQQFRVLKTIGDVKESVIRDNLDLSLWDRLKRGCQTFLTKLAKK